MIFNTSRSDSREFEQDIEWEDEVFRWREDQGRGRFRGLPGGLRVPVPQARVLGTRRVDRRPLHDFRRQAVRDVDTPAERDRQAFGRCGPRRARCPSSGCHGTWGLGYDLWLDATAQFFSLSIDQYSGNLQDYRVGLLWQPKSWVGVGIGYNVFKVDVDVTPRASRAPWTGSTTVR